jgi:rhamnosyltransferase
MEAKCEIKILAVIPVYHPDLGLLQRSLERIAREQIDVILVCNSSIDPQFRARWSTRVRFIELPANKGTAYAYNLSRKILFSTEIYNFLLLADQDTLLSEEYLRFCCFLASQEGNRQENFNIICCPYDSKNILRRCPSLELSEPGSFASLPWRSVKDAKASGMLLPRRLVVELSFNEDLFVDYVDWDYCWRSLRHGYCLIEINDQGLTHHQLGDAYEFRFLNLRVNLPSRSRRRIQFGSACYLFWRPALLLHAPKRRILAILSRIVLNPLIDLLEKASLVRMVDQ